MKSATVLVSLIVALAPLAAACGESAAISDPPAEAMLMSGAQSAIESQDAPVIETKIKAPSGDYLFPSDKKKLFGKSYEEWGAQWWQWAMSIPKSENPMLGGAC